MRMVFPGPIDPRREIVLSGKIDSEHQEAWQAVIASIFELFNSFVAAGGLRRTVEYEPQKLSGRLEWERESFFYTWPKFPFDATGLGIIFRMLGYLRHGGADLGSISVQGTPIAPDHPAAIKGMEDIADKLPGMMPSLPFELEICPSGAWITIECDLSPAFPPKIAPALHEAIWTWGKVANAGGFQVDSESEGATGDEAFGVGIDGPTVADDFLEWHCLKTGVPSRSLNCLVNILGHFSNQIYPVSAVYIG